MKASIIVCTYNRPDLLKTALESLLKQSYFNYEIIIIDDGSINKNPRLHNKIIKKYKQKITYIYKNHSGIFDSMNVGLKQANGDYICFCDDDDLFLSNKLTQQIEFLEVNKHLAGCYSDYLIRQNKTTKLISLKNNSDNFLFESLKESRIPIHSFLFRKKGIKDIAVRTNYNFSADYDWILQIASKFSIQYCPGKPVAIYIRHSNNKTNNINATKDSLKIIKRNYLKNKMRFSIKQKKIIESSIYFREGKSFFWHHKYKKARIYFLKSFQQDPYNKETFIFFFITFLGEDIFDKLIPIYEYLTKRIYIKDAS